MELYGLQEVIMLHLQGISMKMVSIGYTQKTLVEDVMMVGIRMKIP
jgi:hypothetical protein